MVDFKQEMTRDDAREYYSLMNIPEEAIKVFIENVENYVVNHIEKAGDVTVSDIIGTDKVEDLTMKDVMYIRVLR